MTSDKPSIARLLQFQQLMLDFRAIKRQLHIPPGLEEFENDIEHSYSLAMNAWFLAPHFPHLDRDRLIRYALAHDLVEVHAGDTYAYSNDDAIKQKHEREVAALAKLRVDWADFPDMLETIDSYEARADEESKFIYALDKLTPALVNYLNEGRSWHDHGITFEAFCKEKYKKMTISPDIDPYRQELVAILEKEQHLFAEPS